MLLAAGILFCYWQVSNHEFVNYDDDEYVTENRHVQEGLTRESVTWAFTTTHTGNWHPLTWLSHMLDCTLFGLDAGRHHMINVLLHLANALLLFAVFQRMSGALWRSGFVAALFALHPLHVESVAWVAERKDVLSTLFWILTMWSYARYVECPGVGRYLLVMVLFVLGLMAKPMLVTLPFVLLLMDYWPLRRLRGGEADKKGTIQGDRQSFSRLVWEKAPLFGWAVASSVITFMAQKAAGAVSSLEAFPLPLRIGNALVSYVTYIRKMVWPQDLAVFYPHPQTVPLWEALGVGIVLASLSALVIRGGRKRPYLVVGWFWYLGTLVPVIGIVQVGLQGLADRYTYVPLIGLFVIMAWSVDEAMAGWRLRKPAIGILGGVVILGIMLCTWIQIRYWKNTISLFEHALKVTADNWVAHNNLGNALLDKGNVNEAIHHFGEALRIKPGFAKAHNNLGNALLRQGKVEEAMSHYVEALRIQPEYDKARYNLATAMLNQGRIQEAVHHYAEVLRVEPDYVDAHFNLGLALGRLGRVDEAVGQLSEALRIQPDFAEAHYRLGLILASKGDLKGSIHHLSETVRLRPGDAEAHNNLGTLLAREGTPDQAIGHFLEAVRLQPNFAAAHYNLGNALLEQGKTEDAIDHFSEALKADPEYRKAREKLEALAQGGWIESPRD